MRHPTTVVPARVSPSEKAAIEAAAAHDNRTVSEWLRHVVRQALGASERATKLRGTVTPRRGQ